MGHSVLKCAFCNKWVMEGRNDWECDCGAICNQSSKFRWILPEKEVIDGLGIKPYKVYQQVFNKS